MVREAGKKEKYVNQSDLCFLSRDWTEENKTCSNWGRRYYEEGRKGQVSAHRRRPFVMQELGASSEDAALFENVTATTGCKGCCCRAACPQGTAEHGKHVATVNK